MATLAELAAASGVKPIKEREKEPKEGVGKKIIKGIAKPFLRTGLSAVGTVQGLAALASGKPERSMAGKTVDMGYFGKISPIGFDEAEAGKVGQSKTLGGFAKDVVGTGLDIGSNLYAPVKAGGVALKGLKEGIKAGLKAGAKEGAITGFTGGLGRELQNKEATVGSALISGVGEGLIGTALGSVLGVAGAPIKQVWNKLTPKQKTKAVFDAAENYYSQELKNLKTKGELIDAPKLTFAEKIAGMTPDTKKRIEKNPEKILEYFEVAAQRNKDDTLPTAFGYGRKSVEQTRDKLEEILNDTGTEIGKFRKKIESTRVNQDEVIPVFNKFSDELKKLNLNIKNGEISQIKGSVNKTSKNERSILQELYQNLTLIKKDPSIKNIIDNRLNFDNRINFSKSARETSNIVDPISRKIRSQLKEINSKAIGKEQSGLLSDYSELSEVLKDLNKYVDSRSGGEYLLRLVYSGRGEEARKLLETVAKYTGKDLMDDAMAAKLATELIGNKNQLNLFRQEIASAGLDAANALGSLVSGSPVGLARKALEWGAKKSYDPIKVFSNTAKKKLKNLAGLKK